MKFFGKKKKQDSDEDALIDKLTQTSEKEPYKKISNKGTNEAEIEKVNAEINALREILQAQQERFERQSEEIGELRSLLAEREKHVHEIEAKANKSSELVAELQPETLVSEQKKADAKIEAIRAKIETTETIFSNLIDEVKKIKNNMSVFRGTHEVLKLNKEVRDEVISIKKVEATIGKHADRVEAMYTTFESNFQEFEKLKDYIKNIEDTCNSFRKEIEKNRAAIVNIPRKEEFYQVKKEVQNSLLTLQKDKAVYDKRNNAFEESTERRISENSRKIEALTNVIERLVHMDSKKGE